MASARSMPRPSRVSSKAVTGEPAAAAQETTATVQSSSAVKKPPRELRRLPPITGGGGDRADGWRNSGAATAGTDLAAKAWMRRALAKRVAARMLKRSTAPPPPPPPPVAADEGSGPEKAIACCCARLPPGLRCALHQDSAPGRSWMRAQRRGGSGECAEAVAVAPPKARGWAFSEYARWRRHVWMPSRFYLERVDEERAPCSRQSCFVP